MTTDILVFGHASLDYPMTIDEFHGGDATSHVGERLGGSWPGVGGVAYLAAAARAIGSRAGVVSWVGPDLGGQSWLAALEHVGIDCTAVSVSGTRTPSSYLFYTAHQGTICIYDAGDCRTEALTAIQATTLREATWCILAVGPASANREMLQQLPETALLAWAVKHDTAAFPNDVVESLFARSSVISYSEGEREFLTVGGRGPQERGRVGALIIETRGPRGVACSRRLADGRVEAAEITVQQAAGAESTGADNAAADTTGAGDTFIGTLVGLLAQGSSEEDFDFTELRELVRIAAQAATDLIIARAASADGAPTTLVPRARA